MKITFWNQGSGVEKTGEKFTCNEAFYNFCLRNAQKPGYPYYPGNYSSDKWGNIFLGSYLVKKSSPYFPNIFHQISLILEQIKFRVLRQVIVTPCLERARDPWWSKAASIEIEVSEAFPLAASAFVVDFVLSSSFRSRSACSLSYNLTWKFTIIIDVNM